MNHRPASHPRSAFSLLEVILAIALSVIIIYLVFGAIDFHMRLLTVHRTGIEESQLARAILRRVSDDLRAVVINRPIDMSSVSQPTAANTSSNQGASSASGTSQGGDSQPDSGDTLSDDDTLNGLPTTPGLYGNAYELQIDISQVPRYEEYANLEQYQNLPQLQLLSDVKTVSYFMLGQTGLGMNSSTSLAGANSNLLQAQAASLGFPPDQPLRGLGRRIVDRAAVRYAMQGAGSSSLDQYVELMAPEVLMLQFRYFDGQQWLFEWNTDTFGGIPMAVEIVLVLRPDDEKTDDASLTTNQGSLQDMLWQHDPNHVYRLVVSLPSAEMIDTTAATDADGTTDGGTGR